ncbi:MAG: galactose mutarotase [Leptospiraceae bacterium]|nr:galactose mutarotase [Leptospiraceae bacterium]
MPASAERMAVDFWEIRLGDGSFIRCTNFGARLCALGVPDKLGHIRDVVLGYGNAEDYQHGARFFGATAGPFANRIGGARFAIGAHEYRFVPNAGPHLLHSGDSALESVLWQKSDGAEGIAFGYHSPDGDFGFPGPVAYSICYNLLPGPILRINYRAVPTKATHLNLAHHSYFNLSGHEAGTITDHLLEIAAECYLETDDDLVPTGKILSVAGTPLDFRSPARFGERLQKDFPLLNNCAGFDVCYVLESKTLENPLHFCARLYSPTSGIVMELFSDYPALQLYTANHDLPALLGKGGVRYARQCAVCLEPQYFPNSPNIAHFPSTLVLPGEVYEKRVEFRFALA